MKALPRAHKDPIDEFRQIDKNLDAKVDGDELMSGLADWKKMGAKYVAGAFDIDRDGSLSLEEWMVTPQANELLYWFGAMKDTDGDKRLALTEFAFDQRNFVLLRLFFFRRFDRNGDNFLDQNEYEFRLRTPMSLYSINADGTDLKKIDCRDMVGRAAFPSVSPDGKWVAFDGLKSGQNDHLQWSAMVVPIEGGEVKSICLGHSPTWSKDGLKLVCSRQHPQRGTWIIDLVGEDDQFVGQGWGAQWSPDGKKVFFNNGATLQTYDVETQQTETVLAPKSTEYRSFDQGAAWSPDSKRLCIWGLRQKQGGGHVWDALIIDMVVKDSTGKEKEPKDRVKARFEGHGAGSDFAWHPDGRRIVCTQVSPERKMMQFYEFDPDTDDPPKLLPGQPEDQQASGASWTPDGTKLIFTAGDG